MFTRIFAAALFALLSITTPASAATITWGVNASALSGLPGIPPSPTWTVTGSFVFNSALQTITDFNISATGFPNTTPFTLNPLNAQVSMGDNIAPSDTFIDFNQHNGNNVDLVVPGLIPQFATPNPIGIPLILGEFSVGFDNGSGFFLQGGLVSPVPLPDALPLFGSALIGFMGFAVWRSRRT